MRLCRYDDDRLGVVRGDKVHDVTEAQTKIRAAAPYAMKGDAVIAALPEWRARLEEMAAKAPGKPVSEVKLLSPVARPSKLVAAPTNYKAHIEEMAARAATQNIMPSPAIGTAGLFIKANSSLVGPSEGVAIRFPERRNEHEVELAIVFGKQGSDIPRDKALDYVAGYCIGLDMTARGKEDRSFRKSIDSYSVLGPWMVTADEIADPDDVPLKISVNGELKQNSNTKQLIYDCRKLIEWGSTFYTFYPGDVLYTGTPDGVSPVKPGDVMLASIDPIGEMTVPVRAHKAGAYEGNDAMLQVKRIGHATLTTPDLERQLDYYTRVLGLCIVATEKNRAILATRPGQEAIVLEHGDRPAGVRLAFQVAPGSDLGELSARLSKAGLKSETRSDITPGIAQAIVFADPKGTSVEVFSDYSFVKDDGADTGIMPRKLGHVAFHTPDVAGTVKFYCDMLGFKVSDWRSDFFAFLRCSRDHHTINLLQADNANIHHLAFELRDEAEINRACDFLARKDIKLFWGPIRHLIWHNIAIYHKNPDGITVEFFTDLDQMHDEELGYFEPRPWHQDRPQRPKVWGDDTPTNYWGPGHPHDMPGPKK